MLWDGESFLEVTVPPAFKRRLCGLCGNFNGRRRDDLRMRSGQLAQTVEQFGASWKVGGPKSCSSATSTSSSSSSSSSPHRIQQPSPSSSLEHNQRRLQLQQQQQQHPNQLASSSSSSSASIRKKTTAAAAAAAAAATAVAPAAEEPLCQRQWHIRIRAVRECSVLKAATFAQCHPQVSPVRFFK